MNGKKIAALAVVLLLVAGAITFGVARNRTGAEDGDKLQVVASFYPLYEFAKQVGGDRVAVTNLTPAGVDPHDYEVPARALAQAQDADVFAYNGVEGFEPWADAFLHDYQGVVVDTSHDIALREGGHSHSHGHDDDHHDEDEHHDDDHHDERHEDDHHDDERHEDEHDDDHHDDEMDPHYWVDPVLAQQIVNSIRDGLIEVDPDNRDLYTQNAADYNAQLAQLDEEFEDGLAACNLDTIITAHDAFSYAAHRYGFEVEAIAGLSHDAEPTPSRLAELTEHVREEGVAHIFFEHLASPRLADTIARETGAETLVLDPIEGLDSDHEEEQNYLSIQRQNLANLRLALACD